MHLGLVLDADEAGLELAGLLGQELGVGARGESADAEAVRVLLHDVEGLGADGPGGADEGEDLLALAGSNLRHDAAPGPRGRDCRRLGLHDCRGPADGSAAGLMTGLAEAPFVSPGRSSCQ